MITGKRKKVVIWVLIFAFSACFFSFATLNARLPVADGMLNSCFYGTGYRVEDLYKDENGKTGTMISPLGIGSYIQTNQSISGIFSADFRFLDYNISGNETIYTVTFSDAANKKQFDLVLSIKDGVLNIYIRYNGDKFGIAYNSNYKAVLQTTEKNSAGSYFNADPTQSISVSFNPNDMKLFVNGYLLWDFSKSSNDGKDIGYFIEGFANYNVKISLEKNLYGKARIMVYSLLGCDLSQPDFADFAAPALYADVKYNAIVGKRWSIAKPVVFDVYDGYISAKKVDVVIINSDKTVLFNQKYDNGLNFVFPSSGEYYVSYKVANSNGKITEQAFTVKAFAEQPIAVYSLSRGIDVASETGIGTEIFLPICKVRHDLFRFDTQQNARVKIMKNGNTVEDFDSAAANRYTFNEIGKYEIIYYLEKADNALSFTLEVNADLARLSYVLYDESYELGTLLSVQPASITLKNETKPAECVVVFPSGAVYAGNKILLDEIGIYTIRYTTIFGGKQYTFEKNTIIRHSVNSVIYDNAGSSVEFSQHPNDSSLIGLLVTSYPKENTIFSSPIDFSTQNEGSSFIELVSIARNVGQMEYNMFNITLTDVKDSENYIRIRAYAHYHTKQTAVAVAVGNGTPYLFNLNGTIKKSDSLTASWKELSIDSIGVPINHSFTNENSDMANAVISIKLDYETMKLYARAGTDDYVEIADLNDEQFTRKWGKGFYGFTSGKAYCSVNYEFRNKGTMTWDDAAYTFVPAQYMVRKIGGQDFSLGSVSNSVAPVIVLDEPAESSNAIVNKPYKIFNASAVDSVCGAVSVKTYVAYNYGKDSQIFVDVKKNFFIPPVEGAYTLVFVASDDYGNTTEVTRTVRAIKSADKNVDIILGAGEITGKTGIKVYLKEYEVVGGVGNYELSATVKNNCVSVELLKDDIGLFFIPERDGKFVVNYNAVDYVGNLGTNFYDITVKKNSVPVFEEDLILPPVLTAGQYNKLPIFYAKDYYCYPTEKLTALVYVKYPKETEYVKIDNCSEFVPDINKVKTGDVLSFKFEVTGCANDNNVNCIYRDVPVANFNSTSGNIDLSEYYVTNNASVYAKADDSSVYAKLGAGQSSLIFGKKLLADGFTFVFNTGNSIIDKAVFTLYDSNEYGISVKITVEKNGNDGFYYFINNGTAKYNAEFENGNWRITYNPSSLCVNLSSTGSNEVYVADTEIGEKFNGFSSCYIFVKTEFSVTSESNIKLIQINTQNLSSDGSDSGLPVYVTDTGYGGSATVGDIYYIPSAIAGDVFAFIDKVSVTVKMPDGQFATATNGTLLKNADASGSYELLLNQTGKYSILYQCTDTNGLSSRAKNVNLYVNKRFETTDVSISFASEIPSTAKQGKTFTLPKTTVQGEYTVEYVVFDPNYSMVQPNSGNQIVFTEKGKYTIMYSVNDDVGNVKVYRFYITVS